MSTYGSGSNGDVSRGGERQGARKVERKVLEIGADAIALLLILKLLVAFFEEKKNFWCQLNPL